jgi:hypothetical protein
MSNNKTSAKKATFTIPEYLLSGLATLSEKEGLNKSVLVTLALKAYLEGKGKGNANK